MSKTRIYSVVAALAGLCMIFVGCRREVVPEMTGNGEKACYFGTVIEGAKPVTRSLLTVSDIETKVTSVTLAAYKDGSLYKSGYYTSGFDAMPMILMEDDTYDVYAFVNMGDLTATLPSSETGLAGQKYSVPSYSSVNSTGMPMAGLNDGYNPGTATSNIVSVRRLFAKVTLNLSCDWEGASIEEVRIYNMNGSLPLYGLASASNASNILSFQDIDLGSGTEGTYVFYVPENMQGIVEGIEDSTGKSHEENETVNANKAVLTYMEAKVALSGLYSGTVYFRSYLGKNATDNFDIQGNCKYDWTVSFHEEGLSLSTWKSNANDANDNRYINLQEEIEAVPGQTIYYADIIESNIALSNIVHKYSGIYSDYITPIGGGFTVSTDAAVGAYIYLAVRPSHNPTDDLEKTCIIYIVEP